ncbi:MAG: cytochrome c biogenesis heme-transporting ATPase CcmA [Burkholderiales bacterium]|nr:cytochrome c biogenesis heme-transporting ATPase CcmA [Burkholderiales bacterium]
MLEAVGLACMRGQRRLFGDLNFRVPPGEALWVSGPNGSGKTSLLRMLCTLLAPEAGEVRWRGRPVRSLGEAYRAELVYLGHAPAVKDDLSGLENLRFALAQEGRRVSEAALVDALRSFGLAGREDLPARVLSQGQRRRVSLARLLFCGDRPLWILDEPLTALDAQAVELVRALISGHLGRDGLVVLTSHQEVDLSGVKVQQLRMVG